MPPSSCAWQQHLLLTSGSCQSIPVFPEKMLCIIIVLVKFTRVALLTVTLIQCQLKCADESCVSIRAWQIRTLAGFVPWAAQLGFFYVFIRSP